MNVGDEKGMYANTHTCRYTQYIHTQVYIDGGVLINLSLRPSPRSHFGHGCHGNLSLHSAGVGDILWVLYCPHHQVVAPGNKADHCGDEPRVCSCGATGHPTRRTAGQGQRSCYHMHVHAGSFISMLKISYNCPKL